MNSTQKDFIKASLVDDTQEDAAAYVLIHKQHIVSAMFNIASATLIIETTGSVLRGGNRQTMTPKLKVETRKADNGALKPFVIPSNNAYTEFNQWELNAEPTTLTISNREEIVSIWESLFPDDTFDGFEKHAELMVKLESLRQNAEIEAKHKADIESLNLVKADGETPLNEDTVDKVTPIIGINGEPLESNQ